MFDSKIVPRGTVLYKGMRDVSCKAVLNSVHYFFVTDDVSVARLYATQDLCQYRTSRQLNLFNMSRANVRKLLLSDDRILSFEDKRVIAMVTGVEVQKRNQAAYFSGIMNMRKYLTDCSPGERFSSQIANKQACVRMCAVFENLGYDGYFANDTSSVFHAGSFSREIMLCNATGALEVTKSSIPLLSKEQFKKDGVLTMLKLYAKRSKHFLNMFNDMAYVTPVVAPGMAVKLYSEQEQGSNNGTLRIVRNTLDLDITVYVKEPGRVAAPLIQTVFYRFDLACNHFVYLLNQEYDGMDVRLVSKCRKNLDTGECLLDPARKQGSPFINRNVFSVKQYFVLFPDQTEIELMDVVVAYQAGTVPTLDRALSNATGLPLPTRGYLADELWSMLQIDILGKSALNRKRHPVTGKEKQKGVKDLYRLKYIASLNKRVFTKYHGIVAHLINILRKPEYTNAQKAERMRDVISREKPESTEIIM
jgi:hypothetical protein